MSSTPAARYEALIQDLCRSAGIEGWSDIALTQHMMIGDQLVGLIPDLESDEPTLSIYIELGQTTPGRDGALYARLLESNIRQPEGMPGRYALHPESKQAIYCMSFGLHSMDGADIARLLEARLPLVAHGFAPAPRADREIVQRVADIDQLVEA